ncbi:MAG TPA: hypothetical protein VGP93_11645, partial [Polyangiaceae bacterium]|nr:hypothetical protein [Polyangiaceae bacterium]
MKRITACLSLVVVACGASPKQGSGTDDGEPSSTGGSVASTSGGATVSAGGTGGVGGSLNSSTGGAATSAGTGGTGQAGSSAQAGSPAQAGTSGVSSKCEAPVGPGLPDGAPALETGTWKAINPAGFPFDENTSTLGVSVDPCNPAVLYVCTGSYDTSIGGLYK